MQFTHLSINELLNKSKFSHNKKKALLNKACAKDVFIEFHVDDSDMFLEIVQDWPLKGGMSIEKIPTLKTRIVFGQDESVYLLHSLKKYYLSFENNAPQLNKI